MLDIDLIWTDPRDDSSASVIRIGTRSFLYLATDLFRHCSHLAGANRRRGLVNLPVTDRIRGRGTVLQIQGPLLLLGTGGPQEQAPMALDRE